MTKHSMAKHLLTVTTILFLVTFIFFMKYPSIVRGILVVTQLILIISQVQLLKRLKP